MRAAPLIAAAATVAALGAPVSATGVPAFADPASFKWTTSTSSMTAQQSAPVGNGNLAANVWVDPDGAVRAWVARSDAFTEWGQLAKVGGLRVTTGLDASSATLVHDPSTACVTISDSKVTVVVYADGEADVLRLRVNSSDGSTVTGTAEVVRARNETAASFTPSEWYGGDLCNDTAPLVPDSLAVPADLPSPLAGRAAAVWHRNAAFETHSFLADTLRQQMVPMSEAAMKAVDVLGDRSFGLAVVATGSAPGSDASAVTFSGPGVVDIDVVTVSEQLPAGSPDPVLSALASVASSDACSLVSVSACTARAEATRALWSSLWGRSYVGFTGPNGAEDDALRNTTARYVWQRFISLAGGRRGFTPLKFNGMLWSVPTSAGKWVPDFRQWGSGFWSQNTRQAMHEALPSGDDDVVMAGLDMYRRAAPVALARERAYWPHGNPRAFYFPETTTLMGAYDMDRLGWGCGWVPPAGSPWTVPSNPYLRYYYSGTLELALIALDEAAWSGNDTYAADWAVPLADAITAHYFNTYNASTPGGALDMFPSQAMETWQCKSIPPTRADCVTDPITAVAGLRAVLQRLIALPSASPDQRKAWTARLAAVPGFYNSTNSHGQNVWLPGKSTAPQMRNSENVATQPVFPYRITTAAKAAADPSSAAAELVGIANTTYDARPRPCNDGWCWDVVVAAQLNRTADTLSQVLARGTSDRAFENGWPGFAGHYQDYEPSLDEFATLRMAMHAMLLQPLDDAAGRMIVFPTWPSGVDASFKLRGPGATVVTASCVGGKVSSLSVSPSSRASAVLVAGCGGGMRSAAELMPFVTKSS